MIKNAKVGDVVYAYRFNWENDTYNIKKIKVKRDFKAECGSSIMYGNLNFVDPNNVFWTYEDAEARYLVDLEKSLKKHKKELKKVQKRIDRIDEILFKNQPPYLGDPVWESKNEISMTLLNIVDSLPKE